MTQTETPQQVMVTCLGIKTKVGFLCQPPTQEPKYVEFDPGVSVVMSRGLADWLMKQDSTKFSVEEIAVTQEVKQEQEESKKPELVEGKPSWFGKKKG